MKQYNSMKPTTLAHFADTHLGYQKDAVLQKLESETFEYVISDIIQRGVGAVLFCGDTFHVNIPEVRVQKLAIKQLMRLKENNIPVYTIYGSHDFSPLSNSFIDVLVAAGLMQKLSYTIHEGRVRPTPTHVGEYCIMGLPGLKLGRDAELYRVLDRKYVRSNQPDIFLFHGDISGTYDMMSAEMLPADCKLYLGGHIHDYSIHNNIIYPGTLFGGHPNDMYNSARGVQRGYVIYDDYKPEFIPVQLAQYQYLSITPDDMHGDFVYPGKILYMRIHGDVAAPPDVSSIRTDALYTKIQDDTTLPLHSTRRVERSPHDTEDDIMKEVMGDDKRGITLLHVLRCEKPENETKRDYAARIIRDGVDIL